MPRSFTSAWNELDVARYKAEFYRMWHVGYHAGLPHQKVLAAAGSFDRSPTVERMRVELLRGVQQRNPLEAIVRARADLFIPFEASLIALGEESGGLEEILQLLAGYFEAEHRMMLWVKKKMSYPMMNLIAGIFLLPFPILFFGDVLQYVLTVSVEFVAAVMFGGTVLGVVARWFRRRPKIVLVRLCRALALGVEAGLSLDRVVQLAIDAAASDDLTAHIRRVPARQLRGQSLERTFAGAPGIPFEMAAALKVADETGDYTNTLKKLAALYEDGF